MSRRDHEGVYNLPVEALTARGMVLGAIRELDDAITRYVPDSREKSLAFTKLEECRMWATKGITHNQDGTAEGNS